MICYINGLKLELKMSTCQEVKAFGHVIFHLFFSPGAGSRIQTRHGRFGIGNFLDIYGIFDGGRHH